MNVVYVLSPEQAPLMPCQPVIARLLLKQGKAKVGHRTPFTIQLLAQPEHDLHATIDAWSGYRQFRHWISRS